MFQIERRNDGLYYVVSDLKAFMAALVDPARTIALCREQASADAESMAWVCEFETGLDDGSRVTGEYIIDELPGFRALDVRAPGAPREDQKRIADEYHAIPPIIPAQD